MQRMEAQALKSSFSYEIGMKMSNSQGSVDDYLCFTSLPAEEFSVDDFFNLPNDETTHNDDGKDEYVLGDEDGEKDSNSSNSPSYEPLDDSLLSVHLSVPEDDMQELELWSHLMDDSVPQPNLACPKAIIGAHDQKTGFTFKNHIEPSLICQQRFARASLFPTSVPVKPRSKRSRTVLNRSWITASLTNAESSSSLELLSPSSPVSTLLYAPLAPVHDMDVWFTYGKPPVKKPKKKPTVLFNCETGFNLPTVQRRCSHCQVTKTPQWRAGPNGPKSLCNACGVRFKSGRLFPEYRPACSPTFSSEVHSNSHRKVLEMRRKKEIGEPITGPVQHVSNS